MEEKESSSYPYPKLIIGLINGPTHTDGHLLYGRIFTLLKHQFESRP